ncbi:hypothetical protein [Alkalimarinus coralli]|uniref:hypothetical protein n=1 Tax=Alkalimarinus coralli TaxID=2935863 RepID=UPI00202B03A5|nr:hypothetical protein [Alkalimarinus coralli]
MTRPTKLIIVATTTVMLGVIPWYLYSGVEPRASIDNPLPLKTAAKQALTAEPVTETGTRSEEPSNQAIDSFNAQLAQELVTKYGDKIDHLAVQANLFKVRDFVINRYPEDGQSRFNEIIYLAFPNYAESIIQIITLMDQYTQWLAQNYTQLNDMSPLERDGHLWKKRRALFGNDADIIWSDERQLMAQKQRAVQEEIHRLGAETSLSSDEKLYQLQTTLSENYGDAAQGLVIDPGMVAAVFFNFDSVQQTLQNLSPQARQAEINRARKQLGYSEEQIEQAQKKDEVRNQRWENGLAYMAERQQLVDTLEGTALETALSSLREAYFKREAYTIEQEEISGFYRYARPRIYGRN